MSTTLEITQELDGDVLVVATSGELDLATAPDLRTLLLAAIDGGQTSVVLDLRATTFLDSTALGVIIAAMKALDARGGRLVLVNDRRSITKILAITGLDLLLTVERTLGDGLARARQR